VGVFFLRNAAELLFIAIREGKSTSRQEIFPAGVQSKTPNLLPTNKGSKVSPLIFVRFFIAHILTLKLQALPPF
jgi:hypothetical protein